jgi:hypothetical protein
MWLLLFIIALLYVLGNAFLLLRMNHVPKIPKNFRARPYNDDEDG